MRTEMINSTEFATPLYAALIGLVFILLSVRTLLLRRRFGVAIGSGDDLILAKAVRAHANFAEYVPIALLLMIFAELRTENAMLTHVLGSLLIIGRLTHAYGISQVNENYRYRVAGMAMTFTVIISCSLRILVNYAS